MDVPEAGPNGVTRRAIVKSAAWAVPVVTLGVAVPAHAASFPTDLGAFRLNGSCGTLGVLGPGFVLTASSAVALPAGTVVNIAGSGVANIGVFSVRGGVANVDVLSSTARRITLLAAVPAGSAISFRTTLSISLAFTLTGTVVLPSPYTAGTGAKPNGSVTSTLIRCSAS